MSRDAWWRGDGAARPRGGWYERSEGDDGAASGSHGRGRGYEQDDGDWASAVGWSNWHRQCSSLETRNGCSKKKYCGKLHTSGPGRKRRWGGVVAALREFTRMQIDAVTAQPLTIVNSKMSHARHDDNHLELEVEGRRMKGECHRVQLRSKFRFAPELGLSDACPPDGVVCKRDDTGAYLLQAAKNKKWQTDIVKTIVSFLSVKKALPPVQIQDLQLGIPSVEEHPKGRMVVFQLEGQRMSPACLALQRDNLFFFDPAKGWAPASTPAGIDLPEMDASGCYLLYHCTSVEQGLNIMKDAKMRVLSTTPPNWPQGIYTAKRPAEWYNKGCIIKLRIAGVVGSKAVSHQVSRTTDMCPLGFIPVLRRSVQEWVCHPDGCELVEIRFHYEALVGVLRDSPNGYSMQLPQLPYQQPRGGAALLRREGV